MTIRKTGIIVVGNNSPPDTTGARRKAILEHQKEEKGMEATVAAQGYNEAENEKELENFELDTEGSMKANTDTMIHTIGNVVIALLIVGAIFSLWGIASGFITRGGNKLSSISTQMDESDYMQYNGAVVTGTQVVAAIKYFENQEVCIEVNNGHSTTVYIYDDETLTSRANVRAVADAQNKQIQDVYINPNSKYLGEVIRDAADPVNGTIVKISFALQTTP